MITGRCDRLLDWLFEWVVYLPLTLTHRSPSRAIRLLGLLWFMVWAIPAMLVCQLPILVLMCGTMLEDTWSGSW